MKKISLLLAGLTAVFCLAGCSNESERITNYNANSTNGLVVLCTHELGDVQSTTITFIRDTYTDNIYVKCFEKHGYGGGGSLSPYYNADGEIMKYSEFQEVHKH